MDQQTPDSGRRSRKGPVPKVLLHVVLPAAILIGGYLGARHLLATAPQSERKSRPRAARAVEVATVVAQRATPILRTMGVVRAAREVTVRARVGGRVEAIADLFETGGRFRAGEELLRIEKTDYLLAKARAQASLDQAATGLTRAHAEVSQAKAALAQRRAGLAEAEANLALEKGRQEIARREYEMLGSSENRADRRLALRAPQLAIAEAAVGSSEAAVEAAQAGVQVAEAGVAAAEANVQAAQVGLQSADLDLLRTTVRAPFNAWVRRTSVEVGSVVTSQTDVATLIGSDAYWVEATLPLADLKWLQFTAGAGGEGTAPVVLKDAPAWGPQGTRSGTLIRCLGDLELDGRLARLLVEVSDPLHLEMKKGLRHPLLVGSFVTVELDGRPVDDVVVLKRPWLRHGDVVWVADHEDKLRIRSVEIEWRGRSRVFVGKGLHAADRVIVTDLDAPVAGTALRVQMRAAEGDSR